MQLRKRLILMRMTLFPIHRTGHAGCFEDCCLSALLIQYKQLLLPFIKLVPLMGGIVSKETVCCVAGKVKH